MSNLLKKFIVSFLAFLVVFTSITPNFLLVKAQNPPQAPAEGTWYNQSFDQWYNKVYDENTSPGSEIFGERYTAAQVQWVIYSMFAFILNAAMGNSSTSQKAVSCFITNSANIESCAEPLNALIQADSSGQQPTLGQTKNENLLQLVFADRPLSGITYVKERATRFTLVGEAYAQTAAPGFGFNALKPMQDMWRASRDISFGLFVIVAVVFAFMIMFRVKISPQVVISIQSAIPKLIIALVLVTFSYAIAGFLVDLMYVVIGIFSLILPQFMPGGGLDPAKAFGIMTGVPQGSGVQPGHAFGMIMFGIAYLFSFTLALIVLLAQSISGWLLGLSMAILAPIVGFIFILVAIIAIIICLWNMLKAIWTLVKAFANIVLLTIFAPLHITFGTFISGLGFGSWLKSYIANLGTFVGVGLMMFLALVFLFQAWLKTGFDSPGFILHTIFGPTNIFGNAPSSISPYWPPLLGSDNSDAGIGLLFLIVSFVMFTLIPKVSDIIQSFIANKPFAYGSAIGETITSPITTLVKIGTTAAGFARKRTTREAAAEPPPGADAPGIPG